MPDPTFALESEEKALLDRISFDTLNLDGPESVRMNGETILKLLNLLMERSAIPDIRIKYFIDPRLNVGGRGKSRKQVFENNGTKGSDIYRHPHFAKHFAYILYGPALPDHVISEFKEKVTSCGDISSGDVIPLGDFARQKARSFSNNPGNEAEEFYKLALECGIWPSYAEMIRSSVKQAKPISRRIR